MFDNSNMMEPIEWGNIPVGDLTDEELHSKNWNRGVALKGRKKPKHSERMSGSNNPMADKEHPNKGKTMPQISAKIKGKKKHEGFGAKVSAAKKGVPIPSRQGVERPLHSEAMKDPERNVGAQFMREVMTCPHCGKTANGPNYKRWHGDNCKLKP